MCAVDATPDRSTATRSTQASWRSCTRCSPESAARACRDERHVRQLGGRAGDGAARAQERARSPYSILRSTRAGTPATIENGSTSLVTTLPAPTTQRSPMLTPLVTTTLAPSQQLSPIVLAPLLSK